MFMKNFLFLLFFSLNFDLLQDNKSKKCFHSWFSESFCNVLLPQQSLTYINTTIHVRQEHTQYRSDWPRYRHLRHQRDNSSIGAGMLCSIISYKEIILEFHYTKINTAIKSFGWCKKCQYIFFTSICRSQLAFKLLH